MVIKILILLLLSLPIMSQDSLDKMEFLYKNSDFENLLIEIDDYEEVDWDKDYLVLEYKALAKEKLGEIDEAIKIYIKLLKKKYIKENKAYVRSILNKQPLDLAFEGRERMFFYYSKLGSLYVNKYESLNYLSSLKERNKIKKQARLFILLLRSNEGYDKELPEYLHSKIQEQDKKIESYHYFKSYYVYLSFISWQHKMKFIKNSSNASSDLLSTTVGSCTGFGVRKKNEYFDFNFENCFIIASANASTLYGTQSFIQNKVGVKGIFGGPGVYFENIAEDLSVGLSLNYLYASHDYDHPAGTEIRDRNYLRFGYALKSRWDIGKIGFTMSIGKIFRNESSIFQLLVGYYF